MSNNIDTALSSQSKAMYEDRCILVDENDNPIGTESKYVAHQASHPLLHRAFSVFLFARDGRLYLQRRSPFKITFPNRVANTCCSHPLDVPEERDGRVGAERAARRRLREELGLTLPADFPLHWAGRILYRHAHAAGTEGNEAWAEYEVDHIFVGFLDAALVTAADTPGPRLAGSAWRVKLNEDEVSELRPWSIREVDAEVARSPDTFSPWFIYLYNAFVRRLWVRILAAVQDGAAGAWAGRGAAHSVPKHMVDVIAEFRTERIRDLRPGSDAGAAANRV